MYSSESGCFPLRQKYGEMSRSVYCAGRRIDVFEQPLNRPDQREPDTLHDTRVSQRERRGRNPADNEHDHRRARRR